jgi:diadenylate cyclase
MELFRIGFISVGITDLIDIVLVSYIFYRLYLAMRGTIAIQIFAGLLLILASSFVAQASNL